MRSFLQTIWGIGVVVLDVVKLMGLLSLTAYRLGNDLRMVAQVPSTSLN